jgi:putative hemolysin
MEDVPFLDVAARATLFVLSFCAIGFFSGSETAYLGMDKLAIQGLHASGDRKAGTLVSLMEDRENTLSALLIGTNVFTVLASVMSASIAGLYGITSASGLAAVSLATTAVVFMFSELVPKNYAAENPTETALIVAVPLAAVVRWLTPASVVLSRLPSLLAMSLSPKNEAVAAESDSAVRLALDLAGDEGGVNKEDSEVIVGVLDSSDTRVSEVMTPLSKAFVLSPDTSLAEVLDGFGQHRFSRIPVVASDSETVLGVVYVKDVMRALRSEKPDARVDAIMRPPFFASHDETVLDLLSRMRKARVHFAVVTEGDRPVGLATMDDLLEEILGATREDAPAKFSVRRMVAVTGEADDPYTGSSGFDAGSPDEV